jgi:hypothetical protein
MEVSGQLHTLTALPRYTLDRRLRRILSRYGRFREGKNLTLVRIRTADIQTVAILSELAGLPSHS